MRKIIGVVCFLFCVVQINAQDQRLFDNDWYLEKLVIDSNELFLPNNSEIDFVKIDFFTDEFNTSMCSGLSAFGVVYSSESITVNDDYAILPLGICSNPENLAFNNSYLEFYGALDSMIIENFTYEIIAIDDNLQLIITNEDDDQAIYNNVLLNTQSFNENTISLYPNPAQEVLYVESNQPIQQLVFYNALGQQVLQVLDPEGSVSLSTLAEGLYFVEVVTENGKVVKKVVKE